MTNFTHLVGTVRCCEIRPGRLLERTRGTTLRRCDDLGRRGRARFRFVAATMKFRRRLRIFLARMKEQRLVSLWLPDALLPGKQTPTYARPM